MASETRTWTRAEVSERAGAAAKGRAPVFVIDNVVYDVGGFLDEHPGGHEVLLNVAGRDASEDFDDIGHSLDAKEMMLKYRVGEVAEGERREVRKRQLAWADNDKEADAGFTSSWKFPVLLGLLATLLYSYLAG